MTVDEIPSTAAAAPVPAPDAGPSREFRASAAFVLGGVLTLVVAFVLAQNLLTVSPPIAGVLTLAGALVGAVAMLVVAFGIASRRVWAIAVATPMLVLVLVAAAIDFVIALTHGTFNLPIAALLVVWALRAPVRTAAAAAAGPRSWGIAGVLAFSGLVLSTAWPVVTPVLLQSGGPFIVAKEALQPGLFLTCNGAPDVAPASVIAEYRWTWAKPEPLAAGNDTITLEAYTIIDENASGYAIFPIEPATAGIWESDILIFQPKGAVFGVDLGQVGFAPGSVGISLQQAGQPTSPHGSINVLATYLHAPSDTSGKNASSAWRVQTEATCEW